MPNLPQEILLKGYGADDLISFAEKLSVARIGWRPRVINSAVDSKHLNVREEAFFGTIVGRDLEGQFTLNDRSAKSVSRRVPWGSLYRAMPTEKSRNIALAIVDAAQEILRAQLAEQFDSASELQLNINRYSSSSKLSFHRDDNREMSTFLPASTTLLITTTGNFIPRFLFIRPEYLQKGGLSAPEINRLAGECKIDRYEGVGRFFVLSGSAYSKALHSAENGWRPVGSHREHSLERISFNFRFVRPSVCNLIAR